MPAQARPPEATQPQPERTMQVRGQEVIVQDLVMGPEATALWKKIQQLIEEPDIRDFGKLISMFDLRITQPIDAVDWRKPGSAKRSDITSSNLMITGGVYDIVTIDRGPNQKKRILSFGLKFDIHKFCLTKPEIQRRYTVLTGAESAGVHSPQFLWSDKTGTEHNFPLVNKSGAFSVAASGCVTEFHKLQQLEIPQEPIKDVLDGSASLRPEVRAMLDGIRKLMSEPKLLLNREQTLKLFDTKATRARKIVRDDTSVVTEDKFTATAGIFANSAWEGGFNFRQLNPCATACNDFQVQVEVFAKEENDCVPSQAVQTYLQVPLELTPRPGGYTSKPDIHGKGSFIMMSQARANLPDLEIAFSNGCFSFLSLSHVFHYSEYSDANVFYP
jgi:hypothetical protein